MAGPELVGAWTRVGDGIAARHSEVVRPTVTIEAPHDLTALGDVQLATALASGAADVLMALRTEADAGRVDAAPGALRDAGDAAAQAWLAGALAGARPSDAILSEEAADDPRRLTAGRVWIVDPLDGTREFAERTADGGWRDDFAVHVALWQRDRGLTDAAVALPARSVVHDTSPTGHPDRHADRTDAAILEGRRPMRIAVSRSRPPAVATQLAALGSVELVAIGSCGVKTISVMDGTVDAYVHAGGQYEWDSAAPVAVVRAAGLVATRLDGSELRYNQPDPWSPDLLICRPGLHDHLRALLAAATVRDDGATPA
jgi:3'(2'), 5'-bisphosphate nucleotidase